MQQYDVSEQRWNCTELQPATSHCPAFLHHVVISQYAAIEAWIEKSTIVWVLMPFSSVDVRQRFGRMYGFHLQGRKVPKASRASSSPAGSDFAIRIFVWRCAGIERGGRHRKTQRNLKNGWREGDKLGPMNNNE